MLMSASPSTTSGPSASDVKTASSVATVNSSATFPGGTFEHACVVKLVADAHWPKVVDKNGKHGSELAVVAGGRATLRGISQRKRCASNDATACRGASHTRRGVAAGWPLLEGVRRMELLGQHESAPRIGSRMLLCQRVVRVANGTVHGNGGNAHIVLCTSSSAN